MGGCVIFQGEKSFVVKQLVHTSLTSNHHLRPQYYHPNKTLESMKAYINLAIKNQITTYLANTHCATAPAITICWHDRINSEVQTKPIT